LGPDKSCRGERGEAIPRLVRTLIKIASLRSQ
jgi:hypothetical protein